MHASDLEDHFSCLKHFYLPYLGKYSIINNGLFAFESEYTWRVVSTVVSKLKDISRSKTATYDVKMVIFRKWCNIKTFLLHTTIKKWHDMAFRMAIFTVT